VTYPHFSHPRQSDNFENSQRIESFLKTLNFNRIEKLYIGYNSQLPYTLTILRKFENLTTLITEDLFFTMDAIEGFYKMPNLTHVKSSLSNILERLPLDQLKVLHLVNYKNFVSLKPDEDRLYPNQAKSFGKILERSKNLKHLIFTRFYTNQLLNFKGNLETFEIVGVHSIPLQFKNFLKSQKKSLKNLTLDVLKFDDEISNFFYFEMNLVKIFDAREIHGQIYGEKVGNLRELTIRVKNERKEEFLFFKKMFESFEFLEVLNVNLPKSKEVFFLLLISKLKNLKHLKLSHVEHNEKFLTTLKFEKIKKLTFYGEFGANATAIISLCDNLNTVEIIECDEIKKPNSTLKPKLKINQDFFIQLVKNFNPQIGFIKRAERLSFDQTFSVTAKNFWKLDENLRSDFVESFEFDNHANDVRHPYLRNDDDD
jgi:hypothetical protein